MAEQAGKEGEALLDAARSAHEYLWPLPAAVLARNLVVLLPHVFSRPETADDRALLHYEPRKLVRVLEGYGVGSEFERLRMQAIAEVFRSRVAVWDKEFRALVKIADDAFSADADATAMGSLFPFSRSES